MNTPHDTAAALAIPLARLRPHPRNANAMPPELLDKLIAHIARSGRYPPIIVRPGAARTAEATGTATVGGVADASPEARPWYEILDGHHRVEALRRLGHAAATCVVWPVDDAEALVLLATLNRLQGRDDPRRRAALVHELSASMALEEMSRRLPESLDSLRQLAALHGPPPPPRPPQALEDMPVAVHFFLLPSRRRAVEARLREIGGSREAALLRGLGIDT